MDTQALTAFVAVVDAGSFSSAAERLHLTQSAVSKRVATLEDQTGRSLIERHGRRIGLTDAGHALLPHARQVLDDLNNARQALDHLETSFQGPLRLLVSHHIGLHHLPSWLRAMVQNQPELRYELQFLESEKALEQLDQRDAPLAWVTLNDRIMEKFQVWYAWNDPMSFVCGPDHPLRHRPSVELAELAQYQAILPAPNTETYRVVSHLFLEHGLALEAQMPTNYLETIKMMTSVGLGWSVLPNTMLDGQLHALNVDQPVNRLLGAVGLRGREPGRAARELIEVVRCQECGHGG